MLAGNNSRRLIRDIDSTASLSYGLDRTRVYRRAPSTNPDHAPRPSEPQPFPNHGGGNDPAARLSVLTEVGLTLALGRCRGLSGTGHTCVHSPIIKISNVASRMKATTTKTVKIDRPS